jgi:hypothetical protein
MSLAPTTAPAAVERSRCETPGPLAVWHEAHLFSRIGSTSLENDTGPPAFAAGTVVETVVVETVVDEVVDTFAAETEVLSGGDAVRDDDDAHAPRTSASARVTMCAERTGRWFTKRGYEDPFEDRVSLANERGSASRLLTGCCRGSTL